MEGVDLRPGQIFWYDLKPTIGREQGAWRPCVVISSDAFADVTDELVVVVPCTSRSRDWLNRGTLTGPSGLSQPT